MSEEQRNRESTEISSINTPTGSSLLIKLVHFTRTLIERKQINLLCFLESRLPSVTIRQELGTDRGLSVFSANLTMRPISSEIACLFMKKEKEERERRTDRHTNKLTDRQTGRKTVKQSD